MKRTVSRKTPETSSCGFTLLELLIVVSIVLILVAVALPMYQSSILRAKVTKAWGDIHTLHTSLESYFLEWTAYPAESEAEYLSTGHFEAGLTWLTSPIAYIQTLPEDPFRGTYEEAISYELGGVEIPFEERPGGLLALWVLHSYGPDSPMEENKTSRPNYKIHDDQMVSTYSPTNGGKSRGDLSIYAGDSRFMGVVIDFADAEALKNAEKPGIRIDGDVYLGHFPGQGPH